MVVTYHASIKFLQRVMKRDKFDSLEIKRTKEYLTMLLDNVVPSSNAKPFVLPGFGKYKVIHLENRVLTIIPKDRKIHKGRVSNRFDRVSCAYEY